MITSGENKIAVRSLTEDMYMDEMYFNWREFLVDGAHRRLMKKSFRIMNREHKINTYPEE